MEDKNIIIKINGDPVAWERFGVNFKKRKVYDRQSKIRNFFCNVIAAQVGTGFTFKAPMGGNFKCEPAGPKGYFAGGPIFAACWFFTTRNKTDAGAELPTSAKYGDLDNFQKFIFDCCNGIVYRDDSQITTVVAQKRFADDFNVDPHTAIEFAADVMTRDEFQRYKL